jgi:predicted ATP-dependent endonuclease of OLD family
MHISLVEIQNFRKLKSVRIDFNQTITLCVGANNSGKTSAMLALGHFLKDAGRFSTDDFTLSNWRLINEIGLCWEGTPPTGAELSVTTAEWQAVLPALDLWFDVEPTQVHFVRDLLPSIEWQGPRLGVRLLYQPAELESLAAGYLEALNAARQTLRALPDNGGYGRPLMLWPHDLRSFLERKMSSYFAVRHYHLDPSRLRPPERGTAHLQPLRADAIPIEGNPLHGLIRVDVISAQRGLGDAAGDKAQAEQGDGTSHRDGRRLSTQLRAYYTQHLDPTDLPTPTDLGALQAINDAQHAYDQRLAEGFSAAIEELATLNYPGITDPRLRISTRLRPTDGLNHSAAVQYEVIASAHTEAPPLMLPEDFNGLGYQNLISMIFRLMSFRDAWMRVGKADRRSQSNGDSDRRPPLHLVLVEEPEAYLHAQVQQVFVKKAYDVLRAHRDLKVAAQTTGAPVDNPALATQMVISTHSVHVAHECEFDCLRYFRRLPASGLGHVATSAVVNLSETFGPGNETRNFAMRYLRAVHCDLLFADAAILVEGSAERLLVPHFIRHHFDVLHRSYLTVLDIDGSHAHRLKPLVEQLGLFTLIISDLDSVDAGSTVAVAPRQGAGQRTSNATLKQWLPCKATVDELLSVPASEKAFVDPSTPLFAVRIAYQLPVSVALPQPPGTQTPPTSVNVLARTFEDALIAENADLFRTLTGYSGEAAVKEALTTFTDAETLGDKLFAAVRALDKAGFALDLLYLQDPLSLNVPAYIHEGLSWLQDRLQEREARTALHAAPGSAQRTVA